MSPLEVLARQARETLAECMGGTLHLLGEARGRTARADVLLFDDGGRPTFLGDPDSGLVAAAADERLAVLTVVPSATAVGFSELVLAGRLQVVGTRRIEDRQVTLVGLELVSVVVEVDEPTRTVLGHREIPLAHYRRAALEPMESAARRIVAHANDCHSAELRTFVAARQGLDEDDIAAAQLAALDASGVELHWVDGRGAHCSRIGFAVPADSPRALMGRLRSLLTGEPAEGA